MITEDIFIVYSVQSEPILINSKCPAALSLCKAEYYLGKTIKEWRMV